MSDNPMSPIHRLTDQERLIAFEVQSNSIYNKFSPYDASGPGIHFGSKQPYVWTSISDSNTAKHITQYDSQAIPIGSTIQDEKRMAKFMTSGTGLLYIGKQYLIQRQTAFSENRIYNPLSILSATAAKASTGLIERPTRHLEGGGNGFGSFAASSLLSLIGKSVASDVKGVASADVSNYARIGLAAKGKGLVHFESAKTGIDRFNSVWGNSVQDDGKSTKGGFLQNLGKSLLNKFVPSTQPFGFGNPSTSNWKYRPEYPTDGSNGIIAKGVYQVMLNDTALMLATGNTPTELGSSTTGFYNTLKRAFSTPSLGGLFGSGVPLNKNGALSISKSTVQASSYHRYFPGNNRTETIGWYANPPALATEEIGTLENRTLGQPQKNIKSYQVTELATVVEKFGLSPRQHSLERLSYVNGKDTNSDYSSIPGNGDTRAVNKDKFTGKLGDGITLDARGFSKSATMINGSSPMKSIGTEDTYNAQNVFPGKRRPTDGSAPDELAWDKGAYNSKDIIYFYFYDLVNEMYIPFRATISGLNDLHSPDWDEISYLGRADKLYVYKGFTREINFSFTVYANSLKEIVPMWKRINYLVGLSRPSKYTAGENSTGQFMYPPMTTLRLGDMFVDQPCILKSIGVNIPDDAVWETQRGKGKQFSYLNGIGLNFSKYSSDVMYQLPTKVDITINASVMERSRSLTSNFHYFIPPVGDLPSVSSFKAEHIDSMELDLTKKNKTPTFFDVPDKNPKFGSIA